MERAVDENSLDSIDRRSYILGMITAFAECVSNECKKLALSPPFYPQDHSTVLLEAERITKEQGIYLWYEENLDILEPYRLNWFVFYKFSESLDEYQRLRNLGYNPAWHFDKFFDLLSYGSAWGDGAEEVVGRMRETRKTKDTYARILLQQGDWPIPKPEDDIPQKT